MSRNIPPLDLLWLLVESQDAPMHVGAVLVFERAPRGRADLVAEIVRSYRAAPPRPPFTHVPELLNVGMPHWRTVREVDLEHHVQHLVLPPAATETTFVRLIEDLDEPMLDRNRPGFRVWLIEGLPDNRFAMYLKAHHSLIDGMSALARVAASLATSPRARLRPPFFAVDVDGPSARRSKGWAEQLARFNTATWQQTAAIKDVSTSLVMTTIRRLLANAAGGNQPFTAPHLPMNEPIRTARSLALLTLPLAEMRAAGHAFGGTVNDVAATVVDAGLHRYLAAIGRKSTAPLVAMCPVSLRDADDKAAETKVSAIFVPLGAPDAPIAQRMEQVIASMNAGKDEIRAMSKDAAMLYGISVMGLGAVAEAAHVGRMTGHLANFVLSNVPGPREEHYLGGARVAAVHPISALGAAIGLNVTLASYAGSVGFGFVANGQALPDLTDLARYTSEAFADLQAAATRRAKRKVSVDQARVDHLARPDAAAARIVTRTTTAPSGPGSADPAPGPPRSTHR